MSLSQRPVTSWNREPILEEVNEDICLCSEVSSSVELMKKLEVCGFDTREFYNAKPMFATFSLASFIGEKYTYLGRSISATTIINNIYSISWLEKIVDSIYRKTIFKKTDAKDMCVPWNM